MVFCLPAVRPSDTNAMAPDFSYARKVVYEIVIPKVRPLYHGLPFYPLPLSFLFYSLIKGQKLMKKVS